MNVKGIVIALLSLVLMGCGQASPTTELIERLPFDVLAGTSWELTHISGKEVLPATRTSLNFEDFQLRGSTVCNGYHADYDVREEGIKVRTIKAAEFGCIAFVDAREEEQEYLDILQEVVSFELEDNQLTLIASENRKLVFVPMGN